MNRYLFVYGTLIWGRADPGIQSRVKLGCSRVGRGSVRGRLYDLGAYPGVILSGGKGDRVRGVLLRLRSPSALLPLLDHYEEPLGVASRRGLFGRRLVEVRLDSGRRVEAWGYGLNRVSRGARRVEVWSADDEGTHRPNQAMQPSS